MRRLLRDPFILMSLVLVAIPLIAYGWPSARGGGMATMWAGHLADPCFLVLVIVTLVTSRRPTPHAEERRFWWLMLVTCALWLVGNLIPLALAVSGNRMPDAFVRDPFYLVSYVTLLLSADLRPHLPSGWTRKTSGFRLAVAATLLCVIGMVLCFFVIPMLRRSGAHMNTSTLITFVALDVLLTIRFAYLLFDALGTPWAAVYGFLALACAACMVADGLDLMTATGRFPAEFGTPLDVVWWLPFIGMIAARRLRTGQLDSGAAGVAASADEARTGATGLLFVYALSFPTTLLTLDAAGMNASGEPSTRVTVLFALLAFVGLAIAQHRVLERRNRDLHSKIRVLVTNEQVLQSQKLEAIGRLSGGLAHDFNNLLTVVVGCADMLRSSLPAGKDRRDAEQILNAAERGAALTHQLLAFSRNQVMQTHSMDLNAVVQKATPILSRLAGERHPIRFEGGVGLRPAEADPSQTFQVLLNLVASARDAMPDGGTISIRSYDTTVAPGDPGVVPPSLGGAFAALDVSDTGSGMDAETRRHMFEPFFTSKVGGTGLGLAVVYGIVAQSGGHVRVRSERERGTTFTVLFPYSTRPAPREEPLLLAASDAATPRRTVLLVEDQRPVRLAVRSLLEALGYRVLEASTGGEAVSLCRAEKDAPDLLLTDVVMPGMRGEEVAASVRALHPGIGVVFMSGFLDREAGDEGARDPNVAFIAKPFTLQSLRSVLDEVMQRPYQPL